MTDTTESPQQVAAGRASGAGDAPPPVPASSSGDDGAPDGGVTRPGLRLALLVGGLALIGYLNIWMLVVIAALVVMIFLHELGHYLTAKRAGMKVTEFFLFFGPKVWSFQRGETEYGIKCIPAGAYVKIIGMSNLDEVPPADEGRTYRQKTFGQRLAVAVAGSTMHFILALGLIFVALAVIGQPSGTLDPETQAADWRIGQVIEGSGAEAAGLASGDRVISIDGEPITTFDDLRAVTGARRGDTVPVTYERDGERLTSDVTLQPYYSWYVDRVVPDTGPAEAGLEVGDRIVEIDGTSTRAVEDLDSFLAEREGTTVPVVLERLDGEQTARGETEVTVESLVLAGTEGFIGVSRDRGPEERLGPVEALVRTPAEFVNVTALSLEALGNFFTPSGISDFAGQVGSAREDRALATATPDSDATSATLVEGGAGAPAGENRLLSIFGLVRLGADAGEVNPAGLIVLFALINIFIGVFNLVPMLPFDGGHVTIAVYEKIQERRLNRRRYFADISRLMPLTYVVVIGLAMLFFSTLYLDIANPLEVR